MKTLDVIRVTDARFPELRSAVHDPRRGPHDPLRALDLGGIDDGAEREEALNAVCVCLTREVVDAITSV